MGALLAVPAVLAGAAAAPPVAGAASAEYTGGRVIYNAGAGERNDLSVDGGVGSVTLLDAGATVRPGRGCAAVPGGVTCGGAGELRGLVIYVRDEDDRVFADTYAVTRTEIHGGDGRDDLHSGSGNGNAHVLVGGTGADRLSTATNQSGDSTLEGGPGDDVLLNGEGGFARLTGGTGDDDLSVGYSALRGDRMDGGPGEDVYAYPAADADSAPPDALRALVAPSAGVDRMRLQAAGTFDLAALDCGGCVEGVIGSDGPDVLLGDARPNPISGEGGDDVIDPRGGADRVWAGDGADVVLARDGARDALTCGDGFDRLVADAADAFGDGSCEAVDLPAG
jgi:Ca2+-binding RTX toxin-like protein